MEFPAIGYLLMVVSRLLEMFGFLMAAIMIVKGIALRFIFSAAGVSILAMIGAIYSFLTGSVPVHVSFGIDAAGALLVSAITYYGFVHKRKSRLKAPPIPKDHRCPVCTAFVKEEDQYVVAREGKDLFYFDSREHFKKFVENFKYYKNLRKLNIYRIEDVYDKTYGKWYTLEDFLKII